MNINYDPYTSSVYQRNPDYDPYYSFQGDHDYLWSEASKTVERRPVEMVFIDHLLRLEGSKVARPDFLSIDTQGSEYEILLGARDTLKSDVLAVCLEAEFHPLYKGQKLFGDLLTLLSEQGFDFVRFLRIEETSPFRLPIGLRGEGFQTSSDALFFRRLNKLERQQDSGQGYLRLRKLAFMAIVFNQFEYAFECLRRSRDLISQQSLPECRQEPVYLRFLRELEQKTASMAVAFPPTFVEKYPSFESSKSRFAGSTKTDNTDQRGSRYMLKQLFGKAPWLYARLRTANARIGAARSTLLKCFSKLACSLKLMFTRYSDIEAVLINYGLRSQAKLLKLNRVIQRQACK